MLADRSLPMIDNPVLRHLIPPLADLTRWLDAHFIAHAVVGPVADAILWQPRLSCAIDALAALPPGRAFLRAGAAYGFRALEQGGVFIYEPSQIEVRIRPPASGVERQAVSRPLRIQVNDVALAVVTPEDLVALAIAAAEDVTELLAAFPDVRTGGQTAAGREALRVTAVLNAVC